MSLHSTHANRSRSACCRPSSKSRVIPPPWTKDPPFGGSFFWLMEIDFKDIRKLSRRLEKASRNSDRQFRRALLSTRRGSLTSAKRAIASTYNLPQKQIGKHLGLGWADIQNLKFSIYGIRLPLNLIAFSGTSQRKAGASVRILRSGSRKIHKSAWLGPNLGGKRLVLRRVPKSKKRLMRAGRYRNTNVLRQPIEELKGPSVGSMLENSQTVEAITTFAHRKYAAELDRLIKVAIKHGA